MSDEAEQLRAQIATLREALIKTTSCRSYYRDYVADVLSNTAAAARLYKIEVAKRRWRMQPIILSKW